MKLWHCENSRSLRCLWAIYEMDLDCDLVTLPFPPRVYDPSFLAINPLGTVPYFEDGAVKMTESSGILLYLVERYEQHQLSVRPHEADYGAYLNWLFQSDATLTFPQTLVLRYSVLEPEARRQPQVVEDYRRWFHGRLKWLESHLVDGRAFLCANKFTIADIAVAYALYLGKLLKIDAYPPHISRYFDAILQREAFQRAVAVAHPEAGFKGL